MKVRFIPLALIALVLLALPFSCSRMPGRLSPELMEALAGLDESLSDRFRQLNIKQERIASLKTSFRVAGTYRDKFSMGKEIVEEYIPYHFDSTIAWIGRCRDIASAYNDAEGIMWADIKMGEILASAGYYVESYQILDQNLPPPTDIPEDLATDYYYALYRLADNINENSLIRSDALRMQPRRVYIDTLLTMYPEGSYWSKLMTVIQLMDDRDFTAAHKANEVLRSELDPSSHQFALASYWESVICDSLRLYEDRLLWEIRSARADFKNGVKDYASLNMVSNHLLDIDIDRSFRYVQIALEDAVFYDAKLRPWQISHYLIRIQEAYEQRQERTNRLQNAFVVGISLLTLMLLAGLLLLWDSRRKISGLNKDLMKANAEIMEANAHLEESNHIKEEYIGLFLSQLSENIDKVRSQESKIIKKLRYGKSEELLKEMLASTEVEKETDAFYDTFDTTFLSLFPNFVSQFNDLLEESARIVLKKGEKMNTELRIFALMRLGIDDSNAIAGLLKYSVRTIYNYKVKIRNSARIPRDEFDERVKKIG